MTYPETLEFLFKQLPMYQKQGATAFKKNLNNILEIVKILGQPQKKFKSIHIAGTNGKGSTAHMLSSIFQSAGYKTGLYTSPHLKDFRERIKINGVEIEKSKVIDFVDQYREIFSKIEPSFFEWTVGLAFYHFAQEKVDIAIIETGMGGRLDSTNIITPELSIITNIGLDHMEFLGETKELIAHEKAGIIKENIPIVIGNDSGQSEVFNKISKNRNAEIFYAKGFNIPDDLETDLMGNYQSENLKTVFTSWLVLRKLNFPISYPQLKEGVANTQKNTGLNGRWQVINSKPKIILETAHNEDGIKIAMNQLKDESFNQLKMVIGFVNDKKLSSLLQYFPKEAKYYFCKANVPRAMEAEELKNEAKTYGLMGKSYNSVSEAYQASIKQSKSDDLIYVGGSNFVVAEVL